MTEKVINFYGHQNPYGEFSNFYPAPIKLDGQVWPTVEHYFQAMKFEDCAVYREQIRKNKSPFNAKKLGKTRKIQIRKDWDTVRKDIMYEAVYAKFTQHPDLKQLLLSTGDAKLIEHTTNDSYWGDGGDGSGKNMLGKILMWVRNELIIKE